MLDLRLFANRAFSTALGTNTVAVFLLFGIFLFTARYLQLVLGLSPFAAGLWTLPSAVAFIVGSNLVPAIVRWVRPWILVAAGLALAAISFGVLSQVSVASGLTVLIAANVVMSLAISPVFTLTTDMILSAAPPERADAAAALSETGSEFGGALGIAILGSIGTAVYRRAMAATLPADVPPEAAVTARDTLGGAATAAAQLPAPLGDALLDTARAAFIQGLHLNAVIGAVGMTVAAVLVAVLLRRVDVETEPEALPDAEAHDAAPEIARAA